MSAKYKITVAIKLQSNEDSIRDSEIGKRRIWHNLEIHDYNDRSQKTVVIKTFITRPRKAEELTRIKRSCKTVIETIGRPGKRDL